MLVTQSCLTLCNPMDCSLPGCSVHGILQARILEWVALPISFEFPGSYSKFPLTVLHMIIFMFQCYSFFFKSLLNLLQYCFYFMFCFLSTGGIWNFSSSTRDRTCIPALEGKVLTTGLPGKLPATPPQLLVVLKKLKIELPCNPEIPLLSIYPGKAIIPFLLLLFPSRLENSLRGLGLRMSLSSELIPR